MLLARGSGPGQGTVAYVIQGEWTAGNYIDTQGVFHGFLRAPDGTISKITQYPQFAHAPMLDAKDDGQYATTGDIQLPDPYSFRACNPFSHQSSCVTEPYGTLEGSNAVNVIRFRWVTLLLVANIASAADEAYTAETLQWRENFDAEVRDGRWLTGIGNFEIPLGTSTLGSSPKSTMRLPPLHAAKSIGKLIRHGNVVTFSPSRAIRANIDGHTISKPQILSMDSGVGRVRVGSIEFRVRPYADDFYVFVDDLENPAVAEFTGNKWFPIDDSYRISAKFVPYEKPAETRIPLTHIEWKQPMTSTGDVVFTLGGQNIRLKSFVDGDNLFIMFTDLTNGQDTYGGGRFIYAPFPKDGTTTVDFNKAFNPYCSVNQYVYCPIPPPENRLDYRVAAGEQFQGHE